MGWNWLTTGVRLLPLIIGAAHAVESICAAARGKEKQDAAVKAVREMLSVTTVTGERALIEDPDVDHAIRTTLDAYVALQNVIAKKTAPPAAP